LRGHRHGVVHRVQPDQVPHAGVAAELAATAENVVLRVGQSDQRGAQARHGLARPVEVDVQVAQQAGQRRLSVQHDILTFLYSLTLI